LVTRLEVPAGREAGFVIHSLRHFFETFTVNEGIPQRVIDTWLGHRSDKSMAAVYYKLSDTDSQSFMAKVPFGTGEPAADAGKEDVR
jgi:integrase